MAFDTARLMLSAGIVSEADLQRAREIQASQGGSLPRICHELGALDENRWARVVAKALSLPTIDLGSIEVDAEARAKAPDLLLRELATFPFQLRDEGRVLGVAMAEPQDDVGRAQLRAATGCELEIGVAGYGDIEQALVTHPQSSDKSAPPTAWKGAKPDATTAKGRRAEDLASFESGMLEAEIASITPEHARLLEALTQAASRSAGALRAAVDLCVERRLFTADELRARVNRKS
jgi:hypothetical protein